MRHEFIKLLQLVIAASLVNNFVFTRYLGLCIFFGVSKKMSTALGMSVTFICVMVASSALCWGIVTYALMPLQLSYLAIIVFISIIAVLVQAADTVLRKIAPGLYTRFGIYLALISTNCIILAVPLINTQNRATLPEAVAFGLGSGLGFALALLIMASIREKLDKADIPGPFRGTPMAFIVTGMIALAFAGFSGLLKL
jgi:electron transport complex protein RnfA